MGGFKDLAIQDFLLGCSNKYECKKYVKIRRFSWRTVCYFYLNSGRSRVKSVKVKGVLELIQIIKQQKIQGCYVF